MDDPKYETRRRLDIATRILGIYEDYIDAGMIVGSVAYAPNVNVRSDSDVDLIFFAKGLKQILPVMFVNHQNEQEALRYRSFDGYCQKYNVDDVDISVHVLSTDALDVVTKSFISNIRLYRNEKKEAEEYCLYGFAGQEYHYYIKTIDLPDLAGVRTIVPVSFLDSTSIQKSGKGPDLFYMGIHRDKLLSSPKILIDKNGVLEQAVEKLWVTVTGIMFDESMRVMRKIDLSQRSILHAMAKKEKFNQETIDYINSRTNHYLKKLTGRSF